MAVMLERTATTVTGSVNIVIVSKTINGEVANRIGPTFPKK